MELKFYSVLVDELEKEFGRTLGPGKRKAFFDYLKNFQNDLAQLIFRELIVGGKGMPVMSDLVNATNKVIAEYGGEARIKNDCNICGGSYVVLFIDKKVWEERHDVIYTNFRCDCAENRGFLKGVEHHKNADPNKYLRFSDKYLMMSRPAYNAMVEGRRYVSNSSFVLDESRVQKKDDKFKETVKIKDLFSGF